MCNDECKECVPCCLCQWNRGAYTCHEMVCTTAKHCQYDETLEIATENLYNQEPPEPPYEYVEICE